METKEKKNVSETANKKAVETKKETVKPEKQNKVETSKKDAVKNTKSDFDKTEETLLKTNNKNTQNTVNQADKVLEDFFSTPTENATESKAENTWENPPLEGAENLSSDKVKLDDGREVPTPESGNADFNDWGFSQVDNEDIEASTDFNASDFFDDENLMAETILEILDMGAIMGLSALAKDFNNPSADIKWGLSESKKKKILKPLKMVLQKREVKTSPEMMLVGVLLAAYLPAVLTAFAERSAKKKDEKAVTKIRKEAIVSKTADNGRPPKCQRCKKEVDDCKCPEGVKLSPYMKEKLGLKDKKDS